MAKRLLWLGSSRRDIRRFPKPARRVAGFQLLRVQQGLEPNDWEPMASIGAGVQEIRVHTETEHRVCYVARLGKVARSRGNVFRDLGFGREEAEHLLIRSELMIKIEKLLRARSLTQSEAAKIMRVSQPRVSDLLRGRLDLFSTDALIDMLARLGVSVRLAFASSKSRKVA